MDYSVLVKSKFQVHHMQFLSSGGLTGEVSISFHNKQADTTLFFSDNTSSAPESGRTGHVQGKEIANTSCYNGQSSYNQRAHIHFEF